MGKIIVSAFADEYSRDIDVQIRMLKEQGIGYLEPRFVNEKNIADLTEKEAGELRKKLGDIKISSIGSPLGKINLADDFEAHLELTKRVCQTANELETNRVRMFSFYLRKGKSREECREEVLDKLGRMLDQADKQGIMLCHENEAGIYGESPENCRDLLDAFGGRLRCVFDMGNFTLGGYCPYPDAYDLLKQYIEYFHIKDALGQDAIVPPGCGDSSIPAVLIRYLAEFDRDVIVTLEPHLQTFAGLNALTDRSFDNPYIYESPEAAFLDAHVRLQKIVQEICLQGKV